MSESKNKQFSQIPCTICGSSSSGYHFGAISCESCKVFFCRSLKRPCLDEQSKAPYLHRCNGGSSSSLNCQRCRFDKCLAVGMSRSLVCIGRHSAERRLQKTLTLTQLAEKNQLLQGHISRKRSSPQPSISGDSIKNSSKKVVKMKQENPKPSVKSESSSSNVVKKSTVSLVNECEILPQVDISSNVEQLIQQTVNSVGYLNDIRTMPYIGLITPDMSLEIVTGSMMVGMEAYTEIVRRCVKSLPGFGHINSISDRIRLFNGAYHPLYSTQLSLDYDAINNVPRFFSVEPGISQTVILQHIPELTDVLHQFCDSGVAISSAQFTRVELALLCALIFFNPNPHPQLMMPPPTSDEASWPSSAKPGPSKTSSFEENLSSTTTISRLQDVKCVQLISTKYWQAVERFIRSTYPPETASRRLAVFSELLNYFRNTSALIHQITLELVERHPWMVKQSRVFEDMILKLSADRIKPRLENKAIIPSIHNHQQNIVKFEPKQAF